MSGAPGTTAPPAVATDVYVCMDCAERIPSIAMERHRCTRIDDDHLRRLKALAACRPSKERHAAIGDYLASLGHRRSSEDSF